MFPSFKKVYKNDIKRIKTLKQNNKIISLDRKPYTKQYLYKFNDQFIFIEDGWDDNLYLNQVTDYYTLSERIKASSKNNISPLEYYKEHKKEIKALFPKIDTIEEYNKFNDYMVSKVKYCNNFRISVSLTILEIFKPKRWLDISLGWGDRLMSAILYNEHNKTLEEYTGTDPNKALHPLYKRMIKDYKPKFEINLIEDGFEYAELPHKEYDLVFSSPPFFDIEKYSDSEHDSYNKNKTMKEWYENFLMETVRKSKEHLKQGGHLVLYIHLSDREYTDRRFIEEVSEIMKYKGAIYYYEKDNKKMYRGFYIWEKE